jgi:glycosyltransferase involved in cell wall biosynthesis
VSAAPTITCVLPVAGSSPLLDGCIAAIRAQDVELTDVVVVDDSPDASLEPIAGTRTLRSGGRGPYVARNLGARESEGEIVLFLDVRSRPRPDWARRLAEAFRDPEVALAGSDVHIVGGDSLAGRASERHDVFRLGNYLDPPFFRPYLPTCNLAVRREDLLSVGGFRERRSGADADLCWRILARPGRRLEGVRDVLMDWIPRDSLRDFVEQNFRYGKSNRALRREWHAEGAPLPAPRSWPHMAARAVAIPALIALGALRRREDLVTKNVVRAAGLAYDAGYRVAARDEAPARRVVGVTNWYADADNQYLDRLMAAVRDAGLEAEPIRLTPRAVARPGLAAVHIHWPEYLVPHRAGSPLDALRLLRLLAALLRARRRGVRVVWTVHNLGPHDASVSWAAHRAYDVVARTADVFVTHSRAAADRAAARYPRAAGRTIVAPHGHYLGVHPPARRSRAAVRAGYGIPDDAFVLLAFGQIRAYKRLAELSGAVDGDVHLLVAGAATDAEAAAELEAGERVHLDVRRIPDEEVGDLYGAADAAVINYAEVFSSGSLLLALSQGLPVVSAASEAVDEVGGPPAIVTYRELAGLPGAVERLRAVGEAERRAAALAAAEAASWDGAAAVLARAYAG